MFRNRLWAPEGVAGGGGAPAGAGDAQGAAPPPTAAPDAAAQAAAVFQFDPFSQPAQSGAGQDTAAGAQSTEDQQDGQATVQGGAAQPAPAAPPQPDPAAELRQQIAHLQGRLDEMGRAPQAPGAPQAQTPTVDVPAYAFDLPPALVNALNSENPQERILGIRHAMMGVARNVHYHVVTAMRAEIAQVLPELFRSMADSRSTSERVNSDFYGKYPALNRPELRPIVVAVARQVLTEEGATDWNEGLREKVYARVAAGLQAAGFAPAPAAPTNGAPQRGAPAVLSSTPRPNGASNLTAQQKDMLELL